jgi:ribonuclease P protein component
MLAPTPGVGEPGERWMPAAPEVRRAAAGKALVNTERRERLSRDHRLRSSLEIARTKSEGRVYRGEWCTLLALARPGHPSRVGFIASRKGVGGAVERNRARRRLREIVRRRWPRIAPAGHWLLVIAHRGALGAAHQDLASELERLLGAAGALTPIG